MQCILSVIQPLNSAVFLPSISAPTFVLCKAVHIPTFTLCKVVNKLNRHYINTIQYAIDTFHMHSKGHPQLLGILSLPL